MYSPGYMKTTCGEWGRIQTWAGDASIEYMTTYNRDMSAELGEDWEGNSGTRCQAPSPSDHEVILIVDCCFHYRYIRIQKVRVTVKCLSSTPLATMWKVPFNITTDLGSSTQERRSDFFFSLGKETGHASSYLFREPLTLKKHTLDTIPFCCDFEGGVISQRGKPVMYTVM